jgi:hypothetical protein
VQYPPKVIEESCSLAASPAAPKNVNSSTCPGVSIVRSLRASTVTAEVAHAFQHPAYYDASQSRRLTPSDAKAARQKDDFRDAARIADKSKDRHSDLAAPASNLHEFSMGPV